MQAPQRCQEVVDEVTMRIDRTDIVGSGFIQFPPQRPFSEKLERQPPTLSHQAHLYAKPSSSTGPPNGATSPHRRYPQQPQHSSYHPPPVRQAEPAGRTYAPRPYSNPYRPASPRHAPSPGRGYNPGPQHSTYQPAPHSRPPQHQGAHEAGAYGRGSDEPPRGRGPGHGDFNGRGVRGGGRFPSEGRSGGRHQGPGPRACAPHTTVGPSGAVQDPGRRYQAPRPTAPRTSVTAAPAPAPAPAEGAANSEDQPKLTKQQLKRLMKKKRDGKL
jgi:hypothetical protein